jgi:hypothetical protein
MAQGTGTVICKLCDAPLKLVKTQDGKVFLGCECPDQKYLMEDVDRLLGIGELDAVEYENDDDLGGEDDDFDDDDDEYDDDEDEDAQDDDEEDNDEEDDGDVDPEDKNKPKGPSGSPKNGPVG